MMTPRVMQLVRDDIVYDVTSRYEERSIVEEWLPVHRPSVCHEEPMF